MRTDIPVDGYGNCKIRDEYIYVQTQSLSIARLRAPHVRRFAPSAPRIELWETIDMRMIKGKNFFMSFYARDTENPKFLFESSIFFFIAWNSFIILLYWAKAFLKMNGISTICVIRSAAILASNFNLEKNWHLYFLAKIWHFNFLPLRFFVENVEMSNHFFFH